MSTCMASYRFRTAKPSRARSASLAERAAGARLLRGFLLGEDHPADLIADGLAAVFDEARLEGGSTHEGFDHAHCGEGKEIGPKQAQNSLFCVGLDEDARGLARAREL